MADILGCRALRAGRIGALGAPAILWTPHSAHFGGEVSECRASAVGAHFDLNHALQLEEDRGCEQTLGIYLKDCRNISFTNLVSHRTTGVWQPFHTAIQMRNSHAISIRGCEIRGAVFPYDNVLFDEGTGTVVPRRIFTWLEVK